MHVRTGLLVWFFFLIILLVDLQSAVVDVQLNITHGFKALDGVERIVVLGR